MTISVQKEVAGVCIMSIDYDAPGVKLAVLLARHDANAAAFERAGASRRPTGMSNGAACAGCRGIARSKMLST